MTKVISVLGAPRTSVEARPNRPSEGELHLWYWDELTGDLAKLNCQERERYERLIPEDVKRHYLAAHAGLQTILGAYLNLTPGQVEWQAEAHGKPHLAEPGFQFNLSHSSGANLLAVGRGRVGVDIERIRPVTSREGLARRYYTMEEQQELASLAAPESLERFFVFWTRKEAFVKLLGVGLQGELASIDVRRVTGEGGEVARADGRVRCWLCDITVPEGFRAAIATDQRPRRVEVYRFAASDG